jgi:hypothetical protein
MTFLILDADYPEFLADCMRNTLGWRGSLISNKRG